MVCSTSRAVSYAASAPVVEHIAWCCSVRGVSLRWSKLRQHQQLVLAVTHGEGVATYHGSRRQNGDHWAVQSMFLGMALPLAGIGASQVMVPSPTTALEMIQGSVEFVQTVDDGEACCERTVAFACRTKVSSGDHAVVFGGGMHSSRGQEGQTLSGNVPRDSRHTDTGGRPDPVVVSRSQGARLRDRTASRHLHSVPYPWLHSGVLVKTQCAAIVFSPTCVSTWPACWSSKCDVLLSWLTHPTPAATSTISSCEYKGVMDVSEMVCLADLSNDLGLPRPVVALFAPVVEFVTPAHAGHLSCREIHLASLQDQWTRTPQHRQSYHEWHRLQLGTPYQRQWWRTLLASTMCATTAPMAEFIVTLLASAVIAATAVVVEYVALAPSLPSWWQLRSCTQQSRQVAQVHVEESIFRCVPRSGRQHQPCAHRQRQWRSRGFGPSSLITAVVSSRNDAAYLFIALLALFNCYYGSRCVAVTPFVDCCWEQQRRCDVTV